MTPGSYNNNNMQLFQTPDTVVIFNEMVHTARIIPLDGRPHGTLRQYVGDSRARWEGHTLVSPRPIFCGKPASWTGDRALT